ncbi:MAG: nucleoside kinase [Lachnospiraceae bacterium]
MITLTIEGKERQYPKGTTYEEIVKEYQPAYDNQIAVVAFNGKIRELFKRAVRSGRLEFFTLKDAVGNKTYMRTAKMMLLKAVYDVAGAEAAQGCKLEFTVGSGYYVSTGALVVTKELTDKLKKRMQELSEAKMPMLKKSYALDDAMDLFREKGMADKEKVFQYRRSSFVNVYEMEGYFDYYYGYMLPNAGYVKYFDLVPYEEGMMLLLPDMKDPCHVPQAPKSKLLFETLLEAKHWGDRVNITTVGELNDAICAGNISDMILVQEAEQERKIGEIAKKIVERGDGKVIMTACHSSSGKTSFSHRLSIQLRTQGMTPHPIALDDYFVDRELTPRDENGDYNFECLEAIDVELFNQDMCRLLAGETVEMPTFNFKTGKREYKGNTLKLGAEDILVIEGIHGLNGKTSYALPEESKYKIYISALTSLNIDAHNRIPTTDVRLLRRMVRDARTRGSDAKRTIQMWASVRRGEEQNIFPFQESADAMFNSALIYELAVLKQFAEPLLFHIGKGEPEYYEARRLLKFLDYFLGVSSESLPNNSICREFVGGSCFRV